MGAPSRETTCGVDEDELGRGFELRRLLSLRRQKGHRHKRDRDSPADEMPHEWPDCIRGLSLGLGQPDTIRVRPNPSV